MNTRLQVEHPITEETLESTSCGRRSRSRRRRPDPRRLGAPLARADTPSSCGSTPRTRSSSCRARARSSSPRSPSGPGVRVDAGVGRGIAIGVEYDPLLAKLVVVRGRPARRDRSGRAARSGMDRARRRDEPAAARRRPGRPEFRRAGTRPTSSRACRPGPATDAADAGLDRRRPRSLAPGATGRPEARRRPAARIPGSEPERLEDRAREVSRDGEGSDARVRLERDALVLDGRRVEFERPIAQGRELGKSIVGAATAVIDAGSRRWGARLRLVRRGRLRVPAGGPARRAAEQGDLLAPDARARPAHLVAAGDSRSTRGQVLLILEAMKMEHAIRAPRDGILSRLAHGRETWSRRASALAEIARAQPTRLIIARRWTSWEEHAIRRPQLPDAGHGLRGRAARRPPERGRDPVDRRPGRLRRPADGRRACRRSRSDRSCRPAPSRSSPTRRRSFDGSTARAACAIRSSCPTCRGSSGRWPPVCARSPSSPPRPSRFNRHNINAGVDESIERFRPVVARAREEKMRVRGYVSTAFGCPYEGEISPGGGPRGRPQAARPAGRRDLARRHDRRRDSRRTSTTSSRRSTTPASPAACSPSTSTTRAAPRWPTSTRGSSAASRPSTPPPEAWAGVPTRRARRATSRRKTSSTFSTGSGSRPA